MKIKPCIFPLITLFMMACNKPPEKPAAPPVAYFQPDPTTASTIAGTVKFLGHVPPAKVISMDAEEACQKLHPKPVYDASLLVSKGGGLANAFVYIKSGLEGKTFAPPQQAVTLTQQGCQFVPRVIALRKGQTLDVKNADPVSHNIHPQPNNNREWNQQQSPGAPGLERRFGFPEVMIPVKCNVHAWMRSYIAVMEHPYFDVSGAHGEFHLAGLPPGNYVVAVWHEQLGELTQTFTVTAKSEPQLSFEYPRK